MDECFMAGKAIKHLLEIDLKPRDIMTCAAFENAMTIVIAPAVPPTRCSTIAMAHSVGIDLTLDDWQAVSDRVPFIADLKPSGKYVMEDVHKVGGTPGVLKVRLPFPTLPNPDSIQRTYRLPSGRGSEDTHGFPFLRAAPLQINP